jgi:hypothetical protein
MTKVPGFYREALCASFGFGVLLGFKDDTSVRMVHPGYFLAASN